MSDPTGARMRTMNSFFCSPRFPIVKELPSDGGGGHHDHDEDDHWDSPGRTELPGWNAYLGPPE
jgi:hypothetical protein